MQLGCCPDTPRCVLCPPPPPTPDPEVVAALVDYYRTEVAGPGAALRVGFYGGPPPSDALLAAAGDAPKRARVRPDLLTRADVERLARAGVVEIELDAATFDDALLKAAGRRYRGARVEEILRALPGLGIAPGVVLWPGLPGSTFETCVADAHRVAPLVRTARLHPVLVLEGAALQRHHLDGRYRPLELGEAVTVCRAMLDVLEAAGVEVLRVGIQPGPDGFGKALAGPRHPALRQLVEARRTRDVLYALVDGAPRGAHIVIRCAPPDETRARGPRNQHVRDLRARHGLRSVRIQPDPSLVRGQFFVDLEETS